MDVQIRTSIIASLEKTDNIWLYATKPQESFREQFPEAVY